MADLKLGDKLRSHDGQWVTVEEVVDNGDESLVYNLRVSHDHTYFIGRRDWGFSVWAHNACSSTSGNNSAAVNGKLAHKLYNPGVSFDLKVILPSGLKPDAVDWAARIVRELKPNNASAIAKGLRQVEKYRAELQKVFGGLWKSVVDTY